MLCSILHEAGLDVDLCDTDVRPSLSTVSRWPAARQEALTRIKVRRGVAGLPRDCALTLQYRP